MSDAEQVQQPCSICFGSGWEQVGNAVKRCACRTPRRIATPQQTMLEHLSWLEDETGKKIEKVYKMKSGARRNNKLTKLREQHDSISNQTLACVQAPERLKKL